MTFNVYAYPASFPLSSVVRLDGNRWEVRSWSAAESLILERSAPGSLKALVAREGALPAARATRYLGQVPDRTRGAYCSMIITVAPARSQQCATALAHAP